MSTREIRDNGLPEVNRVITTHDDKGVAIFSSEIPDRLPWQPLPDGARFCLAFATNEIPVNMNDGKDLRAYEGFLEKKPGITIPNGTVLRYVDMMPGALSPMHRTVSLDYGVVIEGEVEIVLDSGETKLLKRGDITIQRGTMHAWRNASKDKWARMLYVLQESEAVKIDDSLTLGEDYGGIPGVEPSKGH